MRVSVILYSLALACAAPSAALAAPVKAARPVAATPDPTMPSLEEMRADLRAGLLQSGGKIVEWAMKEYPDEFRTFEDQVLGDYRAGKIGIPEAQKQAFAFVSKIRERVVAYIKAAPDKELGEFIKMQLALMKDMQKVNVTACHEMGEDGALSIATLLSLGDETRARFTAFADQQMSVIEAGKAHPTKRGPVTEAELENIFTQYIERGGGMGWSQALASKDFSNITPSQRCAASILFFETLVAQPGNLAQRAVFST